MPFIKSPDPKFMFPRTPPNLGVLPRELRDAVYSYLGEPSFEGWLKPVHLEGESAEILSCRSPPPVESLLVCRQMKQEVLEHMYRNCTFTLALNPWTSKTASKIHQEKSQRFRPLLSHVPYIRNLNVLILAYEDIGDTTLIPLFLHNGINVRRMTINVRFLGADFVNALISVLEAIGRKPRSYIVRLGSVEADVPELTILQDRLAQYQNNEGGMKRRLLEALDRVNATMLERAN